MADDTFIDCLPLGAPGPFIHQFYLSTHLALSPFFWLSTPERLVFAEGEGIDRGERLRKSLKE